MGKMYNQFKDCVASDNDQKIGEGQMDMKDLKLVSVMTVVV